MTRTYRRVLGLCTFSLLGIIRSCSQEPPKLVTIVQHAHAAFLPNHAVPDPVRERECANQVVAGLARRDGLEPFIVSQDVQVEPLNRIRVAFQFRQAMPGVLHALGTFVKYPRWLGGGRYASTYGRGQPGFELHLDQLDPTRTVTFDALKSSDIDEHEPAGDVASVVLHAVNVVEHEFGQPEIEPCKLLEHIHIREGDPGAPGSVALESAGVPPG